MTEPVKHLNTIVRTHISQNDRVHIPPDSMSINRLRFTALPTNAEKKKVNVQKSKIANGLCKEGRRIFHREKTSPHRYSMCHCLCHRYLSCGHRKRKQKSGFELHATRRNDPPRIERSSNGMRHVLWNCARAFLVAGPARSSRSHGEHELLLRRSYSEKKNTF